MVSNVFYSHLPARPTQATVKAPAVSRDAMRMNIRVLRDGMLAAGGLVEGTEREKKSTVRDIKKVVEGEDGNGEERADALLVLY